MVALCTPLSDAVLECFVCFDLLTSAFQLSGENDNTASIVPTAQNMDLNKIDEMVLLRECSILDPLRIVNVEFLDN